ncbi:class I SAM-dependent methyltransferase [Nocardia yamanashiensis]|uniref:class I SAM-dependent methyltransferase n=1 Tax=Nocardia yamanashiensis TaxID=209247 RepID=UPI00082A2063|nr:class I SAM-dependent methyltransferase [Nocardia yamanashiensis]
MHVPDAERWNHNIHYHRLLADALPAGGAVLDIGCGEGMLARRLHAEGHRVTGIDLDAHGIDLARAQSPDGEITYLQADFLTHPFTPDSFDGIVSVATLHHMDAPTALTRIRDLLRPGGTLAILGMARPDLPRDLPLEAATLLASTWHRIIRTQWTHPSPVAWPPPETYSQMRTLAESHLPGAHYRRLLLWRYALTWTKPSCRP